MCFGKYQSPIDIPSKQVCSKDRRTIQILDVNYSPISGKKVQFAHEYTFMIDTSVNGGLKVRINGVEYTYELNNVHFHLNSEHTFDGKSYEMEMHLVHKLSEQSQDKDPFKENQFLVVGVVYTVNGNVDDEFIKKINFKTQDYITDVDLRQFVSPYKNFYYYHGSLTTPHCDESVNWVVMNQLYTMSEEQFKDFKNYISQEYPHGNNREIQPLNGRTVYYIENNRPFHYKHSHHHHHQPNLGRFREHEEFFFKRHGRKGGMKH